jgi:NADH dehydrogenase
VVIVGGGFGGLAAAKALRHSNVRLTLIDRQNHHLFQPLLCQVAASVLTPGQIGFPLRSLLGAPPGRSPEGDAAERQLHPKMHPADGVE